MRNLAFSIAIFLFAFMLCQKAKAQCIDTLPANTIILSSDTTIGTGGLVNSNYLICRGVKVIYAGTQSIFNHYYLEEDAKLTLSSYHYPYLHMKKNAEIKANHSISPASIIMGIKADSGAIFTDTMNQWTPNITWCTPLTFSYINLPNGMGCTPSSVNAIQSSPEIEIYPNPSNGNFTIAGSSENIQTIRIMDLIGKVILSDNPKGKIVEIKASNFKNGIYILEITDFENRVITKKLEIR